MIQFVRSQARGALIKGSGLLGMVIASLTAPRLFGAEQYGFCVALVAIPFAIQGLLEPAITALTIHARRKSRPAWRRALADLRGKSLRFLAIGSLLLLAYSWWTFPSLDSWEFLWLNGLGIVFLTLYITNTHCMAVGYATLQFKALLWATCFGGLTYPATLWLFSGQGRLGFVLSLCTWQLITMTVYAMHRPLRQALSPLWTQPSERMISWKHEYLPAMAPRMTVVLLNSVTLVGAAIIMPTAEVAMFKVTLTIIGLAKYAIPVSPEMLHVALARPAGEADVRHRAAVWFLGGIFLAACLFSGVLFVFGEPIREAILGAQVSGSPFNIMFFGMPFFYFIGPFSAFLFAIGHSRVLLVGFVAACGGVLTGLASQNLGLGFTLASIAYIITSLGAYLLQRAGLTLRPEPGPHLPTPPRNREPLSAPGQLAASPPRLG